MTLVLPLRQGIVLKFYKNVKKKFIIPKYSEYKILDATIFSIISIFHTKYIHYVLIIGNSLCVIQLVFDLKISTLTSNTPSPIASTAFAAP